LSEMKRIYSALEIPVDEAEFARSVEKHSWENVSEEEKVRASSTVGDAWGMEGGSDPDAGRGGREDDCFPAGEVLP
jgi:hypothetical protein